MQVVVLEVILVPAHLQIRRVLVVVEMVAAVMPLVVLALLTLVAEAVAAATVRLKQAAMAARVS